MDSWLPYRSELRYNGSEHSRTLDFSNVEPSGMECILGLFEIAMGRCALRADSKNNVSYLSGSQGFALTRRAVVRAYLPVHYGCHVF